ncbi:MAG: T9SS type A sorting domain-containing protein [Flavobacteriales bacterium]|nr:T9SS type A sorting domain-containing protein [Flavobacteriales bacterium]
MIATQAMRLAILASLSLGGLQSFAQTTFDIVHSNVSSGFAVGYSVREIHDGYIVFGSQTELDTVNQDCSISIFNEAGLFVDEYYLHRPRFEGFGSQDPIGTIPSGGFVAGQTTFSGGEPVDTVFAVRFNAFGDTLWTKPLLSDTFASAVKAIAKGDHFYFTGLEASGVLLGNNGYVMRTDTSANIELFRLDPTLDMPMTLDVDDQGNMYLGGKSRDIGNGKGYLLKIDSMGDELWHAYQPKPKGNWWGVKHVFGDKLLCMGEWQSYILPPPGEPYDNTMYLAMYSDDGTLQWQYSGLKGKPTSYTKAFFTDGYQDSDSTFIVCGPIQQLAWNRAVIYRFTADGDSLWRRDYAHFGNVVNPTAFPEIPWDIEPTSDGGMVLTGETWNGDTVPPYSDVNMWLLKLDAEGCLVPGCQYVGINEIAYGLEHALRAWPNPGTGRINLALDLPEGLHLEGHLQLQVYDARGRLVVNRNLGGQLAQDITLDLTGQPAGFYSAHISDAHRILTGAKLFVQ